LTPTLIDKNNFPEDLTKIDLSKDVVFVSPENQNILRWNSDGRISVVSTDNLNVSMLKQTSYPNTREIKRRINIKMSFPSGLYPLFQTPKNNSYMRVCPYYTSYAGYKIDEMLDYREKNFQILTSDVSYFMLEDFYIKLIFDLMLIKDENPQQVMNDKNPLFEILITTVYSARQFPVVGDVYYICNDYVYEDFKNQLR